MKKKIERAWLYAEIWRRPATKIAADLGISSSALKRICDAMDVPTPQVGYWQKLGYGKKVKKPRLPKAIEETKIEWIIDPLNSQAQKRRREKLEELRKSIEEVPEVPISTDLENLHPLVKSTRAQIREDARDLSWDKRKDRRRMNAQVSLEALDRTCLILDSIVRACEAAGYELKSDQDGKTLKKKRSSYYEDRDEPSGICWIEADGEQIQFAIREKNRRVDLPEDKRTWYSKYDYVPSGMLECTLGGSYHSGGRTNWRDGKIQKVEKLISKMIAEIPVIAKAKKLARERQARRERHWKYDRELWDFKYRRQGLQEEAVKKFHKHAAEHQTANVARQYVEAVKAKLCDDTLSGDSREHMHAWLSWAEQAIAAQDPVNRDAPPWERRSYLEMQENLSLEPPSPPSDYDEDC